MNNPTNTTVFKERLWPNLWFYVALSLMIPAIMLMLMPVNKELGFVLAPLSYVLIAGFFTLSSPHIEVTQDSLIAGRAEIELKHLGKVKVLDRGQLRDALSVHADARAYLLVRGWIHQGVIVQNLDSEDPAPYWLITTRYPERLMAALAK